MHVREGFLSKILVSRFFAKHTIQIYFSDKRKLRIALITLGTICGKNFLDSLTDDDLGISVQLMK